MGESDKKIINFASDNCSGTHPDVLRALQAANRGCESAYGYDSHTRALQSAFQSHFGEATQAWPVFNGTGANLVSIQAMLPRWGAMIVAKSAHLNTDESTAPERVGGVKVLAVDSADGKLTAELIDREAWGWGDEHRAQPLAISVTQPTELGVVYSAQELSDLASHAHSLGMKVHMDGARVANAAAGLGVPLRAITTDVGVDVLSFGGTKNGLMFGEVVAVLSPEAVSGVLYLRKSSAQLASKMRFISAQFQVMLDGHISSEPRHDCSGELWNASASRSNAMARQLRERLDEFNSVDADQRLRFPFPTQSNAVFAELPAGMAEQLRDRFTFYDWASTQRLVRWMCSFDTTESDVEALVQAVAVAQRQ